MTTHVQRTLALCSWCEAQVTTLSHHPYRNQRDDWQTLGRYCVLKAIADRLSVVTATTLPSQVHIENLLDRLASQKAHCLIERCEEGLLAWEAEGAIETIDEVVPKLWTLLSQEWNSTTKKHGQYYQVYHAVGYATMLDVEAGIGRFCSPQRANFYQEVALLKVESESPQDSVFSATNHAEQAWMHNREVLWFQDNVPLRSTSVGDIVVSLISRVAWIVDHVGFQRIDISKQSHSCL